MSKLINISTVKYNSVIVNISLGQPRYDRQEGAQIRKVWLQKSPASISRTTHKGTWICLNQQSPSPYLLACLFKQQEWGS